MTPRRFLLCFDAHRPDGRVWCVRIGNRWKSAKRIVINVPLFTVYRGPTARQPKAYLRGIGCARLVGATLAITAA